MTDKRRPLSREEAADYLGVTVWQLDRLRYEHGLPYSQVKPRTKCWFDPAAIDQWLKSHERTGAA